MKWSIFQKRNIAGVGAGLTILKLIRKKRLLLILCISLLGGTGCGPETEDPFADFFLFQMLAAGGPKIEEPVTQSGVDCGFSPTFTIGRLPYLVQAGASVSVDITVTRCGKNTDNVELKFSTNQFGANFSDTTVLEYDVPKEAGTYTVSFTVPASLPIGTAYRLWAYAAGSFPTPRSENETAIPQTTSCSAAPGYKVEPVPQYAVRGAALAYSLTVYRCGLSSRSTSMHLSSSNFGVSNSSSSRVQNIVIPATTGTYDFTGTVPVGFFTDGSFYYLGEPIDDVFSTNTMQYVIADATCTAPCNLTVNWDANRETAVNSAGGFYRVYYGTTASSGDVFKDVSYVSGPATPTTTNIVLPSGGLRFIRVKAVSALKPEGGQEAAALRVFAF